MKGNATAEWQDILGVMPLHLAAAEAEMRPAWGLDAPGKMVMYSYPVVRRERFGAVGVPIFPIDSLFNGEPRSYLEFPNHAIVWNWKLN